LRSQFPSAPGKRPQASPRSRSWCIGDLISGRDFRLRLHAQAEA
jgi:hypothetical protein